MVINNSGVAISKVFAALALALLAGVLVNGAIMAVDQALNLESAVWGLLNAVLTVATMGGVFWWLHKRWLRNASGVTVLKVLAALALALLAGVLVGGAIVAVGQALNLESAVWRLLNAVLTVATVATMGGVFWWLNKRWLRNTGQREQRA